MALSEWVTVSGLIVDEEHLRTKLANVSIKSAAIVISGDRELERQKIRPGT